MNSTKHICIIAEAGVNHNGSMDIAKQLVCRAKESGADYIKFQTFVPENLVSRFAQKAEYQKETTGEKETQLQMLRKLALTYDDFHMLKEYCMEMGIGFVSTPFDLDSIDFLESLDMDFWKVPSGEITNLPYLEKIGKTGRDVVLSTGMCQIKEIRDALEVLEKNGAGNVTILHCNTEYPTPYTDVNLKAMAHIQRETGLPVGYSDHTAGIEIPIAAAALGAAVIEKHFTLDKTMEGPDHRASLEPDELRQMVLAIRHVEAGLGDGIKRRTTSESKNLSIVRKSVVAKRNIARGEVLTKENITVKRPGNGINPMKWNEIIGTFASRDFIEDELIEL